MTTRIQYATTEPTQLLIRANSHEGKQMGILIDSAISCENIYTIEQLLIRQKIGDASPEIMEQMDVRLKISLGLE